MRHTGKVALLVAIVGAACVTLMLFGARLGLWEPITGFGLYRSYLNPLGAVVLGAGVLALIVHLIRREFRGAVAGGVAALVGLACLFPLIFGMLNPARGADPRRLDRHGQPLSVRGVGRYPRGGSQHARIWWARTGGDPSRRLSRHCTFGDGSARGRCV